MSSWLASVSRGSYLYVYIKITQCNVVTSNPHRPFTTCYQEDITDSDGEKIAAIIVESATEKDQVADQCKRPGLIQC